MPLTPNYGECTGSGASTCTVSTATSPSDRPAKACCMYTEFITEGQTEDAKKEAY